jgi:hypothetical protein
MATNEQKKEYKVAKDFDGVNTKASRTSIKETEFAWIENTMPVGHGNLKSVYAQTSVGTVTWAGAVTYLTYCNINNINYAIAFENGTGKVEYSNLDAATPTNTVIANSGYTGPTQSAVWSNQYLLIADYANGYSYWDGTNIYSIGSLAFTIGLNGTTSPSSLTYNLTVTALATGGVFTINSFNTIVVGMAVTISGTLGGTGSITGYTGTSTSYYVIAASGSGANITSITLSATLGGSAITTTSGTLTGLTYTLSGAGYTGSPTATVSAPSSGTTAVIQLATNGNVITSVSAYGVGLTTGTGYTSSPTVTINSSTGKGITITASVFSITNPTCIASFSGRVWIANGRTLYYTAAGTYNDFFSPSAGNIVFQDETLVGNITALIAANNFLYVFGSESISVISDVRINTTTGSTLYTNTNISASVGTDQSYAVLPYFRSIVFMNRSGVYALVGSTTSKLSDSLDGLIPYIDFTNHKVSCGQVLIFNILCACFNVYYTGTQGTQGAGQWLQLVFFDKKWFFTYQGTQSFIVSAQKSGLQTIYGTTGLDLWQFYQSSSTNLPTKIQTPLYSFGNVIRDKQALKWGIEAILGSSIQSNLVVTTDSESTTSPSTTVSNFNAIVWLNNSSLQVIWLNNSLVTVNWGNLINGYYLYKNDSQMWGKYIGLTVTSTSPNYTVAGFEFESEMRAKF